MVLATEEERVPWTAPVYYVYTQPNFYFFSSPKSRHIRQAGRGKAVAASIFSDSDQWQQIQGLQMTGTLTEVKKSAERIKASAKFLVKFPFAKPFLQSDQSHQAKAPNVADRVKLYTFIPEASFYVNNRLGFGNRLPILL